MRRKLFNGEFTVNGDKKMAVLGIAAACAIIGSSVALTLIGIFLFVTFSGFGSSAEFIYNQF